MKDLVGRRGCNNILQQEQKANMHPEKNPEESSATNQQIDDPGCFQQENPSADFFLLFKFDFPFVKSILNQSALLSAPRIRPENNNTEVPATSKES